MCLDFHSIAGMKKNVCILSSAYLPPIQYMSKLLLYDEVIIDAMEHYRKQSYRNRCQLYGANGILPLTVPLMHLNSENTAVRDMKIANDFDWQKVHWRSLESAYRCSPFFEYYEDYFMEFYSVEQQSLLHFNNSLLHKVCDLLRIKPNITHALEYVADYGEGADDSSTALTPAGPGNPFPTLANCVAARPSGTEDVYKIYAESFNGPEHLAQVQAEAREVVSAALGA